VPGSDGEAQQRGSGRSGMRDLLVAAQIQRNLANGGNISELTPGLVCKRSERVSRGP